MKAKVYNPYKKRGKSRTHLTKSDSISKKLKAFRSKKRRNPSIETLGLEKNGIQEI